MLNLDESVKLVSLQFSFSNRNAVPAWLPSIDPETPAEQQARAKRNADASGEEMIPPTEKCSLAMIVDDLEEAGYVLVDGLHQERINAKDTRRTYQMCRFVFLRRDAVEELRDELGSTRAKITEGLGELCLLAMWRVRAFLNPLFKGSVLSKCPELFSGDEPPHAASINMETREPLFRPDGQPIMVWQKDENGERTGAEKVPLSPKHCLCVEDGAIQLQDA
ncbi:hypothetical protein KJ885_01540 [Patescibacteria group bacterium]|nr:hypothetical protein [Patescibacteria group bacterium]